MLQLNFAGLEYIILFMTVMTTIWTWTRELGTWEVANPVTSYFSVTALKSSQTRIVAILWRTRVMEATHPGTIGKEHRVLKKGAKAPRIQHRQSAPTARTRRRHQLCRMDHCNRVNRSSWSRHDTQVLDVRVPCCRRPPRIDDCTLEFVAGASRCIL